VKKTFLLTIILWLFGCQSPVDIKSDAQITVAYLNKEFGDTLKLTLEENFTSPVRKFSEIYQIPIRPVWDPDELGFDTYKDEFYYIKGEGLFRIIDLDNSFYAGKILAHFKDFIWIPYFMFKNDTEFIVTSYHSRRFDNEFLRKSHFGGALNVMQIKLSNVYYDESYKDTLRTFIFKDTTTSHEKIELKTYDSNFNLVQYGYKHVNGGLSEFRILSSHYKKMKEFRKGVKAIFLP